jgi:hypothetical protein
VRLLPVSSPLGECPAQLSFHVPVLTSLSLTPPPSRLVSAWPCSILCPRCSSRRPRLEVLNVSQNRVQCVTGLHLLPSLVVLNLGKCLCSHEPDASAMRSPQCRPFATAPLIALFMAGSAGILSRQFNFLMRRIALIFPPHLLIFNVV